MRKVGDITEGGWEITKVEMRPIYTQRRRVRIVEDFTGSDEWKCRMEKFCGKLGWQYSNNSYVWVELDVYPGKTYRFRDCEIEVI
jgi:hypothetical protein